MTQLVVGCPVWDRAWALDTWFDSVEANCDPADTGLVFVVPKHDHATREKIQERCQPFAWCEVVRDRNAQYDRQSRHKDKHESLAQARNLILRHVQGAQPDHYLSWDSDLFVAPGVVSQMIAQDKPIMTVWTWLNRTRPMAIKHFPDPSKPEWTDCWYEPPMCATAMVWDGHERAHHLNPRCWDDYAQGVWQADVVLAFKLMQSQVYTSTYYAANVYGEDIPFNWQLQQRGIERWVYGESVGVHLALDKPTALDEIEVPYPQIMGLADQIPLGASKQSRSETLVALGYYPMEGHEHGTGTSERITAA